MITCAHCSTPMPTRALRAGTILGAGLLLASVTAVLPLAFGRSILDSGSAVLSAPIFGSIKVTIVAIDAGDTLAATSRA